MSSLLMDLAAQCVAQLYQAKRADRFAKGDDALISELSVINIDSRQEDSQ